MIKVRIVPLMPFSAKFGGAEIQVLKYIEYVKKVSNGDVDIDFLNPYTRNIDNIEIIHFVEANYEVARILIYLKKKGKKIVVSPIFYKDKNAFILKVANKLLKKFFIPNWFKSLHDIFYNSDILLPNSYAEKEYLEKVFGKGKFNIKVIYNGIDDDFFENVNASIFKNRYSLSKYILSVGRIGKRKNTLRLIEGYLKSKIYLDGYKLVIIGNYSNVDHKYEHKVRKLIEANKDKIIFVGFIDRNSELFKSAYLGCDLHVLPSILETPGLANLEAALAGKKIVVGDCPPVREYFNGIATFVNPYSVDDIAKGIVEALNRKIEEKKQIEYIKSKYSWKNIARQLVNIYKEVSKL